MITFHSKGVKRQLVKGQKASREGPIREESEEEELESFASSLSYTDEEDKYTVDFDAVEEEDGSIPIQRRNRRKKDEEASIPILPIQRRNKVNKKNNKNLSTQQLLEQLNRKHSPALSMRQKRLQALEVADPKVVRRKKPVSSTPTKKKRRLLIVDSSSEEDYNSLLKEVKKKRRTSIKLSNGVFGGDSKDVKPFISIPASSSAILSTSSSNPKANPSSMLVIDLSKDVPSPVLSNKKSNPPQTSSSLSYSSSTHSTKNKIKHENNQSKLSNNKNKQQASLLSKRNTRQHKNKPQLPPNITQIPSNKIPPKNNPIFAPRFPKPASIPHTPVWIPTCPQPPITPSIPRPRRVAPPKKVFKVPPKLFLKAEAKARQFQWTYLDGLYAPCKDRLHFRCLYSHTFPILVKDFNSFLACPVCSSQEAHDQEDMFAQAAQKHLQNIKARESATGSPNFASSDHFQVLGLSRYASKHVISKQFRALSLLHHPDKSKHPDAQNRFAKLNQAKTALLARFS